MGRKLAHPSPNNWLPIANAFSCLFIGDESREFRKHSILRARSIFFLELVDNSAGFFSARLAALKPSSSQMHSKCKIFVSAVLCDETCKPRRRWCCSPAFVICKLSYFPTTSDSGCSLVDMPVQWRLHIFTYLQVVRKSRYTNLMFTGAGLLVQRLVPIVQGHTAASVWSTSRLSLALMPRTLQFVSPANVSLNFCGDTEQRLCNSSHGCTKVNGNCYIRFMFQMHASSHSIQMWRLWRGGWVQQNAPVKCFNWLRWMQFVQNGGCVVTMSRVFFRKKRQSQIKIRDKVNGWEAKWASRDVLMLLLTSETKGRKALLL